MMLICAAHLQADGSALGLHLHCSEECGVCAIQAPAFDHAVTHLQWGAPAGCSTSA